MFKVLLELTYECVSLHQLQLIESISLLLVTKGELGNDFFLRVDIEFDGLSLLSCNDIYLVSNG